MAFGEKFMELLKKLLQISNEGISRGIWDLPIFEPGRALEQYFPHIFDVTNYPVIDYFYHGIASSIKSVDLMAETDTSTVRLNSKLRSYVRKVSEFRGRGPWGEVPTILPNQILGRRLDLVIPSGATPEQMTVINNLISYGRSLGNPVDVIVKIVAK